MPHLESSFQAVDCFCSVVLHYSVQCAATARPGRAPNLLGRPLGPPVRAPLAPLRPARQREGPQGGAIQRSRAPQPPSLQIRGPARSACVGVHAQERDRSSAAGLRGTPVRQPRHAHINTPPCAAVPAPLHSLSPSSPSTLPCPALLPCLAALPLPPALSCLPCPALLSPQSRGSRLCRTCAAMYRSARPSRRCEPGAAGPERCAWRMWCWVAAPGASGLHSPSMPASSCAGGWGVEGCRGKEGGEDMGGLYGGSRFAWQRPEQGEEPAGVNVLLLHASLPFAPR